MLYVNLTDLHYVMLKRKDLKKQIDIIHEKYEDFEDRPTLDYTRRHFHQDCTKHKNNSIQLFQGAVNRCLALNDFNRQRPNKLQELIKRLKKENSQELKNEAKKTESVIQKTNKIMT